MTDGSIIEIENDVLRARLKEVAGQARDFLDAVQRYVEPKKGDRFISRNELLNAARRFRACIDNQRTMR